MIFRQRHVGHSILDFPGSYSNWIKGTKGKNSVLEVKNVTYEKKKRKMQKAASQDMVAVETSNYVTKDFSKQNVPPKILINS